MNKTYTLSPSNQSQISQLLSPIFHEVRRNKINSFHQLEKYHLMLNREAGNAQFILNPKPRSAADSCINPESKPKTAFNFYSGKTPSTTLHKAVTAKNDQESQPSIELPAKKQAHRRTVSVTAEEKNKPRAHFRVQSKLKKHLVETIDFDQIQKMLYKKKETITRYEYFMQMKNMQGRMDPWKKTARKARPVFNNYQYQADYNEGSQQDRTAMGDKSLSPTLRTPRRKKFWAHPKQARKQLATDGPLVLGKMYRTVQV